MTYLILSKRGLVAEFYLDYLSIAREHWLLHQWWMFLGAFSGAGMCRRHSGGLKLNSAATHCSSVDFDIPALFAQVRNQMFFPECHCSCYILAF